jgi:hypothetical protein
MIQVKLIKLSYDNIDSLDEKSGIYAIKMFNGNKIYVGQTVNFRDRLHNHLEELECGSHHNENLQNDFNSLGNDVFGFVILETIKRSGISKVEFVDFLSEREMYWFDFFKTEFDMYNINKPAISSMGKYRKIYTAKNIILTCEDRGNLYILNIGYIYRKFFDSLPIVITPETDYLMVICTKCLISTLHKERTDRTIYAAGQNWLCDLYSYGDNGAKFYTFWKCKKCGTKFRLRLATIRTDPLKNVGGSGSVKKEREMVRRGNRTRNKYYEKYGESFDGKLMDDHSWKLIMRGLDLDDEG